MFHYKVKSQLEEHKNCKGKKFKCEIDVGGNLEIDDHKKYMCAECNGFLLGKFPSGINCSCGKIFHEECYIRWYM